MEGGGFPLGNFLYFTVQLRGGGLVELGLFGQTQDADGFQDPQDTDGIHVTGVFRNIKGNLHMGLCSQIVNLVGLNQADDPDQRTGIGQIAIVQGNGIFRDQMINAIGCFNTVPADQTMYFISFF